MSGRKHAPAVGSIHRGRVVGFIERGAMVSLGKGLTALLKNHAVCPKNKLAVASEHLAVGDDRDVVVLKVSVSKTSGSIFVDVGLSQPEVDPWSEVDSIHPIGSCCFGRIIRNLDSGTHILLDSGFLAFIHMSELSWSRRKPVVDETLAVGDRIEVAIVDTDSEARRIDASLKRTLPDPWQGLAGRFPPGTALSGRINSKMKYGYFIDLEIGVSALLHKSEIAENPAEFALGDPITIYVLAVNETYKKLAISMIEKRLVGEGN